MPGLLSRSKSMRLLKSHRKDAAGQDTPLDPLPSSVSPQTHTDAFRSTFQNAQAEANIETQGMPVRPSTSGGPGERKAQFHMKTIFVPPVHSQSDLVVSSTTKSEAFLYPEDAIQSREGIIGIALGSPTVGSHWNSEPHATSTDLPGANSASTAAPSMAFYGHQDDTPTSVSSAPAKSKLSRWKSLFKKAGPTEPQLEKSSFYQLATTVTTITANTRATRADSHHDDDSIESIPSYKNTEDRGRVPSPPTFKRDIRASRKHEDLFMPPPPLSPKTRARAFTAGGTLPVNPRVSIQRSSTAPIMFGQSTAPSTFPNLQQAVVSSSTQLARSSSASKPLLDVSIPDIKMERYSVMFGNLLQPTSNPSSSLLVRRHGNAEKLRPLNGLSVKGDQESPMDYKLQRRATSPVVPSPSPRLSLFPNTNQTRAASPRSASVPRLRVLNKSKAMPEKSPLNQVTHDTDETTLSPQLIIQKPDSPLALKPKISMSSGNDAITPSSTQSFDSESDSVTFEVETTAPLRKVHLDDGEPEWEICTKRSAIKSSVSSAPAMARQDSQTLPRVTKFCALSSNPASAPLDAPSPLQRISSMRSPPLSAGRASDRRRVTESSGAGNEITGSAMVGVARSISVSKANSPRALVRTNTDLSSPERLVEKATLTPTMVEVRNRRSQRVQLVDA